jgi:hypothetical protein
MTHAGLLACESMNGQEPNALARSYTLASCGTMRACGKCASSWAAQQGQPRERTDATYQPRGSQGITSHGLAPVS